MGIRDEKPVVGKFRVTASDVTYSVKSKNYWVQLMPALIWQVLYLVIGSLFSKETRVYLDLIFYLGIAVYFFFWKQWQFSQWFGAFRKKIFWRQVLFTVIGMAAMFGVGAGVSLLFAGADNGMNVFGVRNWPTLIAFALVTIVLPPIAEEAFYRRAVTAFDSKSILVITTLVSIMLYAGEHSLMPLGFFQACLWAVPLNVAYIKTRNIYVCMTAHFICNLVMNGMTVVACVVKLMG